MSDLMLYGVLRMPFDMAMSDYLSQCQFYDRVQEAARRLEAAEARLTEIDAATPPSPSTAPEELRNVFDLAWKQALDDAAFYVAGHCADGERHVEHIRELVPPKLRVRGVEIASRPAEVDDEGLPPLPNPVRASSDQGYLGYTAEQYRQGQRDAVAADRALRENLMADQHIEGETALAEVKRRLSGMISNGDLYHTGYKWALEMVEIVEAKFKDGAAPSHTTNKENG